MKKVFSLLLTILIVWNIFIYNTTNAAGVILSVDYSNFNWDQELKISWSINNKIDSLLLKNFSWDYYNQFIFLKTLNTKVFALWKKVSVKQKPLIDELKNYLSIKWDFIYKKSMVDDNEKIKELDNTFKKSLQTKWITINKIIENIDNINVISISNQNNNFENLTQEDFVKIVDSLIDDIKINKYKTSDEILSEAKEITVEDFKKIKDILPSNLVMKDEFNNLIRWEIKYSSFNKMDINSKLIEILNQKLESFWNITKDKLNSEVLLWMWDLYNVLENDDLMNNYLSSIKTIWKIGQKAKILEVKEIKQNNTLKSYLLTFESDYNTKIHDNNDILDYWDIKVSNIWLNVFIDKNWNIKHYLTIPTNKYIYLWNDKYNKKQYIVLNLGKNQISFIKENGKNFDITKSNINIVFEDNYKIDNNKFDFSLEDFKEILNKKVVKINIDWEDITNSELLQKWSILNTIK